MADIVAEDEAGVGAGEEQFILPCAFRGGGMVVSGEGIWWERRPS